MCEMMERGYRGGQTKYDGVTDRPTNEVHYIIRAPKNSSSCGDLARFAHIHRLINIIIGTTTSNKDILLANLCVFE